MFILVTKGWQRILGNYVVSRQLNDRKHSVGWDPREDVGISPSVDQ